MNATRPLLVLGTRPEAIKMAPVIQECHRRADVDPIVCFTGQHREMVAQVADYFGIKPDLDLDLMLPNQTLAGLTARCIERLDRAVRDCAPDCIVAQGDTTTVMVASMTAFYHRLPFVHVEAGLRTGDMYSPWPEEFNRRVAGLTASLHCAPTRGAAKNLLDEGVTRHQVHVTGNTVIDALLWTIDRERASGNRWVGKYSMLARPRMVLITGHRRENFGGGFAQICEAIVSLAKVFADVDFVYPVHLNPNVQKPVQDALGAIANVHLMPPASYPEFVWLMDRSYLILTDSGGVQEEAPSLKKPVLVMRDTTERPEAIDAGGVELVGASCSNIVRSVSSLLKDKSEYARRQIETNPYGDGDAANRIMELVVQRSWESRSAVRIAA
ncbi:MAG: UDP-N-acetylglucosamine 2-epimerase (non-hydrolyzing) [Planctomycetaceae bacterium]|nr:UDP-N-acetylglucosamine 2-epimerase (non-hydrolyzing) [Planctomycetales bacterium]MCB9920699.1 UDP-N-acetylglucosamine 2-epimerase (non-hydrolyzing) [Planctomycetaceae bacterium]